MEEQQSPLPPAQDGDPAGDGAADGGWKVETNGDGAADEDRKAQSNGDGADPESTAQFNIDDDYGYDYGYDDWGFGTWTDRDQEAKLRTRAVEERLDYLGTTRQIGLRCVEQAREEARVQYLFQAGVGILLLIGGAWALAVGIRMLLTANVGTATAPLAGFTITDVAAGKLVTPVLAPPLVLALLGFALIGLALYVVRHRVLQNSLMGVSNIQHELAAGTGETRPLVRVVQETINNARQTFTTVLRLSQALFWVGLLFLAVTLFRAVWQDHLDLLTLGTGVMGAAGWLFSLLISQKKDIQTNLADVTQLELGLVALAKQVTYADLCLSNAQSEPRAMATQSIAKWGMQEIERSAFAIAGLVELYAQSAEKDDQTEHRRLLHQAVRMHTHLDTPRASELRDLAGEYASVLMERAGLLTAGDLLDAAATPDDRNKLVERTGIRSDLILEFAKLADLLRLGSVDYPTACLLRDAGIDSVQDLANADSTRLCQELERCHIKQNRLSRSPTQEQVDAWIAHAQNLEDKLKLKAAPPAAPPAVPPAAPPAATPPVSEPEPEAEAPPA